MGSGRSIEVEEKLEIGGENNNNNTLYEKQAWELVKNTMATSTRMVLNKEATTDGHKRDILT